jgi:hypothetical protein
MSSDEHVTLHAVRDAVGLYPGEVASQPSGEPAGAAQAPIKEEEAEGEEEEDKDTVAAAHALPGMEVVAHVALPAHQQRFWRQSGTAAQLAAPAEAAAIAAHTAARSGSAVCVTDAYSDARVGPADPHADGAAATRSLLALPMRYSCRGGLLGVVLAFGKKPARRGALQRHANFGADDATTLDVVLKLMSAQLENAVARGEQAALAATQQPTAPGATKRPSLA